MSDADPPAKFAGGAPPAQAVVTFGGQVMVGGVTSLTVIVWVHVAEFPQSSVALYVLVIV